MKVLVTGATGFVGSHLVDRLLERGAEVTALVRSPSKAAPLATRGVRLVTGDLHATAALAEAVRGQDAIIHAAALTGAIDEAEFLRANRDGTANLIAAASQSGSRPRFVLVGSMAAGGPAARGAPRRGTEPDAPVTMYGRSKLASEQVVRASALPWVILRPPTVYGPRDRDNLIAVFKLARVGVVPVFGDGTMELSAVYAPDLAAAAVIATEAPGALGNTYYVNHPEVLTSGELVRTVARTLGKTVRLLPIGRGVTSAALAVTGGAAALFKRRTILRPDKIHEFFQPAWTGDPSPFMRDTGWVATHDLAAGLAATYAWYRNEGWL